MASKPYITRTLDRLIAQPNEEPPVRVALTLNVWAAREQVDVSDAQVEDALIKAAAGIERVLLGTDAPARPSCESCHFWLDDGFGRCRRHSPIIVQVREHSHQRDWPQVSRDNWCGDYQLSTHPKDDEEDEE